MDFEGSAPAKLNLRLRIAGRRADGMHLLESETALTDFGDRVRIGLRTDGKIRRTWTDARVADDLCVRAAEALRAESGVEVAGADIFVEKRIPIGGGLGGGSSDAATVLLGLNRLWDLGWTRARLMELGLKLGSDIPFFLSGLGLARMEGVGDRISELAGGGGGGHFVLSFPGVSLGTGEVYGVWDSGADVSGLTSGLKSAIIALSRWNDLSESACFLRPRIAECARALGGDARMSGSGSCVFLEVGTNAEAERIRSAMEGCGWTSWTTRLLSSHPLRDLAED